MYIKPNKIKKTCSNCHKKTFWTYGKKEICDTCIQKIQYRKHNPKRIIVCAECRNTKLEGHKETCSWR